MITGQLKSKVDQLWNAFWSGGVSNPLSVIEQITYLLFAKRLDDLQLSKESKANLLNQPIEDPIFEQAKNTFDGPGLRTTHPKRNLSSLGTRCFPSSKT